MRLLNLFVLLILVVSCKTIHVNEQSYKTSNSKIELGALGEAKSIADLKNNFTITAYPKIEEKIKLGVAIVPFTKKANKIYQSKEKFNQKQSKINYVDSLPVKPEMVSIRISDIATLVNILNSNQNNKIVSYIKNNERTSIITSILVTLDNISLEKVRSSDTYYLIQTNAAKLEIMLYKQGKKVDVIDLSPFTVIGYTVGKFCWYENERNKWMIGDIVPSGNSCKGKTFKKIQSKKEKSLYKM